MHTYGDGTEASVTLDIPYQMADSDTPADMSALPGSCTSRSMTNAER